MEVVLIERERELAEIEASLNRTIAGEGSIVLVEGEAGIGKTELLRAAAAAAVARGIGVISSRGSELERDYAYGVVRQLLLPAFAAMPRAAQSEVSAGAAHLAGPALGLDDPAEAAPDPDRGAVLHGLYWLAANMAGRQPLLVSIDDAQWSDMSSMRFLAFLAHRLEKVPILLLLAMRDEDAAAAPEPIAEVANEALTRTVRPRPLSDSAVRRLIGESLSGPIDPEFTSAFVRATGGVPFLVRELLKALEDDGIEPTARAVAIVDSIGPRTVTRSTMLRLARVGEAAVRAARGVTVLGRRASVSNLSSLTGAGASELTVALDALVSARILRAGPPVEFLHPLVRTSVYEDIPPYIRSDMHARAAALLADAQSDPEESAAHLLSIEPRADPRHVDLLAQAARRALGRGAPDAAAAYLERALESTSDAASRGGLLHQLGRCELVMRDPACIPHLRAAVAALDDRRERGSAALALADGLFYVADLEGSRAVLAAALDDLSDEDEDEDEELAVRLQAAWANAGYGDPRFNHEVRAELPRLRLRAEQLGSAARELNVVIGLVAATNGENTADTLAFVERGLDHGRLLDLESSDSIAVATALNALVFVDELDRADELATAMLDDARHRGLVLGFIAGSAHRGFVALRRGELERAEAETRIALELAQQHQQLFTIPFTLSYLGATMLERGDATEAAAMLEQVPLPPGAAATLGGAQFRQIRGRLRLATGDRAGGIDDIAQAGEALDAIAMRNPNIHGWRSELALAIAPDDHGRAASLVSSELASARDVGSPRAIGIALRASGLLNHGEHAVSDLREAVAILEGSPARLEYARALTDLGAALRRANARSSARDPLRLGLELAIRCGASPLAERARRELLACGGRPRRMMVTGRDALTASEQRIAELAAGGDSNRTIAQSLFITPKTVENHLGRIYKKLAINSRDQLAAALEAEQHASESTLTR